VPAAAVIPAPIAYINVVAVKKLVVGFLVEALGRVRKGSCRVPSSILRGTCAGIHLSACGRLSFTVNKLECSKQGVLEYISME
jgi:hypothetical protein